MTSIELHDEPTTLAEDSIQYTFVINSELAQVGGGAALVDY